MPRAKRLKPGMPVAPESDVLATCRGTLESHGCRVERRNTGAWKIIDERTGKARWVRFGEPGGADLFGCFPDGRHFELEVKRKDERPRLEQVRWLRSANRWAPAFWVDSDDALRRILPALIEGARVVYLPDPWRFRIEADLPGGAKVATWIWEPGGDFDIHY